MIDRAKLRNQFEEARLILSSELFEDTPDVELRVRREPVLWASEVHHVIGSVLDLSCSLPLADPTAFTVRTPTVPEVSSGYSALSARRDFSGSVSVDLAPLLDQLGTGEEAVRIEVAVRQGSWSDRLHLYLNWADRPDQPALIAVPVRLRSGDRFVLRGPISDRELSYRFQQPAGYRIEPATGEMKLGRSANEHTIMRQDCTPTDGQRFLIVRVTVENHTVELPIAELIHESSAPSADVEEPADKSISHARLAAIADLTPIFHERQWRSS